MANVIGNIKGLPWTVIALILTAFVGGTLVGHFRLERQPTADSRRNS